MRAAIILPGMLLTAVTCGAQLANPDFESAGAGGLYSAASWIEYGAVNREPWANHAGGNGMALEWWNGTSGGFYQDVSANAGVKYKLTAWCQDDTASVTTGVYAIKLEYYDNAMTLLGADTLNISSLVNAAWQQITLNGTTTPSNCARLRVLFCGSRLISGETLKIDDVQLTLAP